ncbi:hypothetical protein ZEAMMB73_Zm00001d035958 [Zea mays]|uniref:Uncharacterized protein n=1 Tax=Zea mays TaxID=4577 RepID=A0A1D6LJV0_MAIZE|nr:hypothetical protein ZEAMMB73_Zm00001d035958 [Zea mays]
MAFMEKLLGSAKGYRWMGPARYDFSVTMVFLKHRSYGCFSGDSIHSFTYIVSKG